MFMRIAQVAGLLAAMAGWNAYAAPTLTLIPPSGTIHGSPGATVGWGFTISNDTGFYLLFDSSNFCGPGGDPFFTDCSTPYNGLTQFGPSQGTYTDYIATNTTIIPPHSTVTQPFNSAAMQGVGAYMISAGAPMGATDLGKIFVSYQQFAGNPLTGGIQQSGDIEISAVAQVVVSPPDAYQIGYAANLSVADSFVDLTNVGTAGGSDPAGDICANVYVFASDQQLIECCSCLLTPNHLQALSAQGDLTSKTLTPGVPGSITIGLVATTPVGGGCNPAAVDATTLAPGLRVWGTTIHAAPGGSFGTTEFPFSIASLSDTELAKITSTCGFIQADGSGYGLCKSCRPGALGAKRQ
jgi:hypothetical protein